MVLLKTTLQAIFSQLLFIKMLLTSLVLYHFIASLFIYLRSTKSEKSNCHRFRVLIVILSMLSCEEWL